MSLDKENMKNLCLAFEIENSIKNPACFEGPTKNSKGSSSRN